MAQNFRKSIEFCGLGTAANQAVPDSDMYVVAGTLTIPSIPAGSSTASSVVVVVNKNGSPVYTGNPGSKGFKVDVVCVAADVLSVVLSSAAAVDNVINAVRSTITMSKGDV